MVHPRRVEGLTARSQRPELAPEDGEAADYELLVREFSQLLALPGDPDLTLDADGVTVCTFVRLGNSFHVALAGGFGSARDPGGELVEGLEFHSMSFQFGFPDSYDHLADEAEARLARWAAESTPLRFTDTPRRLPVLLEDWRTFQALCTPRQPSGLTAAQGSSAPGRAAAPAERQDRD